MPLFWCVKKRPVSFSLAWGWLLFALAVLIGTRDLKLTRKSSSSFKALRSLGREREREREERELEREGLWRKPAAASPNTTRSQ